jgi:hypothetical protein
MGKKKIRGLKSESSSAGGFIRFLQIKSLVEQQHHRRHRHPIVIIALIIIIVTTIFFSMQYLHYSNILMESSCDEFVLVYFSSYRL